MAPRVWWSLLVPLVAASTLRAPPLSFSRLRGGDVGDAAPTEPAAEEEGAEASSGLPPPKALSRDEILDKLNAVPTFSIVNEDGGQVAMMDAVGETRACCWFTDAAEARAILKVMQEANPTAGLKLACHGLGGAFTVCNGWKTDEGTQAAKSAAGENIELRLQGNHHLANTTAPRLRELLAEHGFDPGCWTLPVFLCDRLASASFFPVFLSPRDLAVVWEKSGRKKEELPKDITVMDLRMLVQQWQTDANPWEIFHLVGSTEGAALAAELTGAPPPDESNGAPTGAQGAAEAGMEAEEEEEEEVMV